APRLLGLLLEFTEIRICGYIDLHDHFVFCFLPIVIPKGARGGVPMLRGQRSLGFLGSLVEPVTVDSADGFASGRFPHRPDCIVNKVSFNPDPELLGPSRRYGCGSRSYGERTAADRVVWIPHEWPPPELILIVLVERVPQENWTGKELAILIGLNRAHADHVLPPDGSRHRHLLLSEFVKLVRLL